MNLEISASLYHIRIFAIAVLLFIPSASKSAESMKFEYHSGTQLEAAMDFDFRYIEATGVISEGTADEFANFLAANSIPSGITLIFNSPGGSVVQALKLGQEIRDAGLNTSLSGPVSSKIMGKSSAPVCFSACTLAFLGGMQRNVGNGAYFGVHQVSSDQNMSSQVALQLGQITVGMIAGYAASMGVKAEFVYYLTQASPDAINILSAEQLARLGVTTPEFSTTWEIKPLQGQFYLLGATETRGQLNKLILFCTPKGPQISFLYNTSGKYMEDALAYTSDYGFELDKRHVDLLPSEIVERVNKSGSEYIAATVSLTPRLLEMLKGTDTLTFEMMMPSHITYFGWTTDFESGRSKFFSFLQSCNSGVE